MVRLLVGDCRTLVPTLAAGSVHCVVTSPPYWGLRDYGTATWAGGAAGCDHQKLQGGTGAQRLGKSAAAMAANVERSSVAYRATCGKCGARRIDQQIGLEATPEAYVAALVDVFRAVWRVLRDDGTLWLNLGDSYAGSWGNQGRKRERGTQRPINGTMLQRVGENVQHAPDCMLDEDCTCDPYPQRTCTGSWVNDHPTLKPKDLVGMPWRVAFALQAAGWFLRADCIWHKPNPMPESVTDRPTKAHEYVFLLTKSARYFYDADAVREPATCTPRPATSRIDGRDKYAAGGDHASRRSTLGWNDPASGRNLRSVWTINPEPTPDAHFATFPRRLVAPCIEAGTSAKGACAACGAPRVRQVEREANGGTWLADDGKAVARGILKRPSRAHGADHPAAVTTTGWAPSCACDAATVPCVVLDPFGGTGTTGRVAEDLGRDSIVCELNPAYGTLAARKTAQGGLFATWAE